MIYCFATGYHYLRDFDIKGFLKDKIYSCPVGRMKCRQVQHALMQLLPGGIKIMAYLFIQIRYFLSHTSDPW